MTSALAVVIYYGAVPVVASAVAYLVIRRSYSGRKDQ